MYCSAFWSASVETTISLGCGRSLSLMSPHDPLRFDAQRLRILIERHHLFTGSARARALLEDWDNTLRAFVKIVPQDYRRALLELKAEREGARMAAAE